MFAALEARLSAVRSWALAQPYLGVIVRANSHAHNDRSKDMAAGIAYFTFLSLFPLILGLISLGGFFLKSEDVQLRVNGMLLNVLPVSADFVTRNIDALVSIRGTAGLTSVLILLWSGSKMVGALSRAINQALGLKRHYAIYLSSLRYFALTVIVALLIFMIMAISPAIEILSELQLELVGDRWNKVFDAVASRTVGVLVTLFLITVVYVLVPYRRLPLGDLLPGILFTTTLIEIGKTVFVWYVEKAADYNAVYGSVSSIIVLLIWLYFAARILLLGAEIISVNRGKQ